MAVALLSGVPAQTGQVVLDVAAAARSRGCAAMPRQGEHRVPGAAQGEGAFYRSPATAVGWLGLLVQCDV